MPAPKKSLRPKARPDDMEERMAVERGNRMNEMEAKEGEALMKKMYGGKMILRFDDTNPTNEKIEFVDNIMADLKMLDIVPDRQTFSSDYFEELQNYCRKLIKDNNAYADDTPALQMKEEREKMIESKCCLENSVEKNL